MTRPSRGGIGRTAFVVVALSLTGCGRGSMAPLPVQRAGHSASVELARDFPTSRRQGVTCNAAGAARRSECVLYTFPAGLHGAYPQGLFAGASGVLFGTTAEGGSSNKEGYGTVFQVTPSSGAETVLYSFQGGRDGADPHATVVADSTGALYGTTIGGGVHGAGTVFKLTPTSLGYAKSTLHLFTGPPDGAQPDAHLIIDARGVLFGTTTLGGTGHCIGGCGTVFELVPSGSTYTERVIYSLRGGHDGRSPVASLLADASGALYGTTYLGGTDRSGVVFKMTPTRTGYSEAVVHEFLRSDSGGPQSELIGDGSGALYGTTPGGGASSNGVVFKLTPTKTGYAESVIHVFSNPRDGAHPSAGLLAGPGGALYGVTGNGGDRAGHGTAFTLTPAATGYAFTVLYRFRGPPDGAFPSSTLVTDATGAVYGVSGGGVETPQCLSSGGGCGTVFRLSAGIANAPLRVANSMK
jgi:uncharacterized repeat protein (TIGR03803 family)